MSLGSHLRKDANLLLRDGKGLALALALPIVILFAYARLDLRAIAASGRDPDAFILVICTTFPVLLVASTALVAERRMGTFGRLARSPARILEVVASKTIAAFGLLLAQVAILVVAAILVLPRAAGIQENPGDLALVLLLAGLAAQTLGLLLGALAATEVQAMQMTSLAFLLMFTLSGFLQPTETIPTLGRVAGLSPMALGYEGGREAIAGRGGFASPLALLGVSSLFLAGATLAARLRRA